MTEEARAREVLTDRTANIVALIGRAIGWSTTDDLMTAVLEEARSVMLAYAKPADREAIARVIDPETFDACEHFSAISLQGFIARQKWEGVLAKADAILSLPHPKQGEMT